MIANIPLKRVARVQYGLGQPPKLSDHGIPILRATNITRGKITETDLLRAKLEDLPTERAPLLAEGEILVVRSGAYTGDSARVTGKWVGSAPGYDLRLTPQLVDSRYLAHSLLSSAALDQMKLASSRAAQPHLNAEELGGVQLWIPPLDEQRRIADFLDAETARIDSLVVAKEKAAELIDERRIALTSQLCLRGLDSNAPMRPSRIGPLGEVPAHWTVTRNKNFMREVADLSAHGNEELLTVSHLTGVTPRSEKTVYMFKAESMVGYKICQPGDLVINTLWAWMGALGISRHNGIVSPAYGVYRLTSEANDPEYFHLLHRTPEYVCEMTRFSKGVWSSRLRLYPESFLALSSLVPPPGEQREIVKTVHRELGPGMRLQGMIRSSNALLAERRQALITAAVTGQFDVSTASGRNVTDGVPTP